VFNKIGENLLQNGTFGVHFVFTLS